MITFEDLKSGRVKLEMCNPEHAAVVRAYEQTQEYIQKCCPECAGEGVISHTCPVCKGSGERKQ